MNDRITIKIDPKGQAEVAVKGVKGASCKDVTAAIEKALGQTTSDKLTSEYYETPLNVQNTRKA
jgi:hypothetical protein